MSSDTYVLPRTRFREAQNCLETITELPKNPCATERNSHRTRSALINIRATKHAHNSHNAHCSIQCHTIPLTIMLPSTYFIVKGRRQQLTKHSKFLSPRQSLASWSRMITQRMTRSRNGKQLRLYRKHKPRGRWNGFVYSRDHYEHV